MATSSIFANVKITDPKKAEVFVDILENEPKKRPSTPDIPIVANPDTIRELMAKKKGSDLYGWWKWNCCARP